MKEKKRGKAINHHKSNRKIKIRHLITKKSLKIKNVKLYWNIFIKLHAGLLIFYFFKVTSLKRSLPWGINTLKANLLTCVR